MLNLLRTCYLAGQVMPSVLDFLLAPRQGHPSLKEAPEKNLRALYVGMQGDGIGGTPYSPSQYQGLASCWLYEDLKHR